MKTNITAIMILLVCLFPTVFGQRKRDLSADEVLTKTAAKLRSLKTMKFDYRQEYNYASEAFLAESHAECVLEFTMLEQNLGMKFQFRDLDSRIIYNGSEIFTLNEKGKTLKVQPKPTSRQLTSNTYLAFGPLMLRNSLPKIIAEKSIEKSVTKSIENGRDYFVVEFALDKAFIESSLGREFTPMEIDRKSVYRIKIEKRSFMPVEVYRGNNANSDFNRVTYSRIETNPKKPEDSSWYYSTFLNQYRLAEDRKVSLIKSGEIAPEFSLPLFPSNEMVSLSSFKGKVVLLDFWIFHCGYCQASVPKLNAIADRYKDKEFKLLTINPTDSPDLIKLSVERLRSRFEILQMGADAAAKYGVGAFPSVVLVGKDGRVVYSGIFAAEKIDEMLRNVL